MGGAIHAFGCSWAISATVREHEATTSPFADSETYGAQTVYSTNPALMWADMASSNLYGLGATTDGVAYAADYCLDILDASCGTDVQRCETGIVLPANREVEYWLDLLSMYANCIWYPWGSDLRIQPDERVTALAPCGRDILLQGILTPPASGRRARAGLSDQVLRRSMARRPVTPCCHKHSLPSRWLNTPLASPSRRFPPAASVLNLTAPK